MGAKSNIEWTDATWNMVYGCTRASEGCDNCYAVRQTQRLAGTLDAAQGLVNPGKRHFNGQIRLLEDRLDQPLRWKRPRRIFVNSLSDLFHPEVPFSFVDRVYDVMCRASQHTFQILTKRPDRMKAFFTEQEPNGGHLLRPSLPNVWLGTSVEDQAAADERIPHLLQTPTAVRFLSCEPLLGPVDIRQALTYRKDDLRPEDTGGRRLASIPGIDWVIVGGESGSGARPMHPGWVRSIRDQCQAAGVPLFFKQWGAWKPVCSVYDDEVSWTLDDWLGSYDLSALQGNGYVAAEESRDGTHYHAHQPNPDAWWMARVGKKAAGRELDGRTWDDLPHIGEPS